MDADNLPGRHRLGWAILVALGGWLLLSGCAKEMVPETIALEYGRALYASDLARAYRLLSTEDQRVKGEETFRRERDPATGFALEVAGKLASFIEATLVEKTIEGQRARIKLKLRLPNANAPEIAALVHGWEVRRLNALSQEERGRILDKLDQLQRAGKLPMLEGEETFELVRESSGWRVFVNWAGGIRVRFSFTTDAALPLKVTITPVEVLLTPGERVSVTVRTQNLTPRDMVIRVSHRVEPKPIADSLALLYCPLFIPVTLKPGETEEFRSEYLLLKDVPEGTKQFQVTYEFLPAKQDRERVGSQR